MIVYKTTNLINGKIYIGRDKHNNSEYYGSGKILKKAIKKYGKDNFKKEILEYCNSNDELNEREKYWIKELKSQDKSIGYNIANGGTCGIGGDTITNNPNREEILKRRRGKKHTDATKKKMSDKKIGIKIGPFTIDHKQKIKESSIGKHPHKGNKNPMYGKKRPLDRIWINNNIIEKIIQRADYHLYENEYNLGRMNSSRFINKKHIK